MILESAHESLRSRNQGNGPDNVNVMKTDFINPFRTDLDSDELYNLASVCLLPDGIPNGLLSIYEDGKSMQDKVNTHLNAESPESELFFSPIKRVKWRGFRNESKKVKVVAGRRSKGITSQ